MTLTKGTKFFTCRSSSDSISKRALLVIIFLTATSCVPVNQKKITASDNSQTVDTTPPTNTSISIDSGAASTNSTSVFLTLEATEATEMYVTNTPGCGSGGAWESFITSRTWTLGQTNGVATVYVKFRDALLNESSCINDDIFQVDEDPVVGPGPTFSSVTNNSATVSWGAASDSLTPTPNLDYKLVRATSPDLIDTVLEADAIAGSGLVMDWDTNVLTASATGLTDATTYFFAVLVRDEADNKALYSPDSVKTLDGVAPTVGTNLVFSSVASTSMTVSWGAASDNVTPQESLRYKLVKSISSDAIDTIAEVEAITGDDLLVDWDVNTTTHNVTGLTVDTTYYFAVLVQDAYDNLAIYPIASETTFDGVAPTIGTSISFSSVTGDSMTVSWGAGSDNVTAQESLQYKLVKATTSTDIDSIEEVEAISGGDLLVDWGTNILSHGASGLLESTTYYFSVVVRDSSGNKAIYTVQGQSTSDSTAPVIGNGITYSNIASTSVSVNWGKATDSVTPQAALEYKVVKASSSGAIDTIAEADGVLASDVVIDWTDDIDTVIATGLTSATTYYFAVLVRDLSGNKSLYIPAGVGTTAIPNSWTNLSSSGAPAGRYQSTSVWTGSEMIVWGGMGYGVTYLYSGGKYDPLLDSWTPTNVFNAPAARTGHSAVWTGAKMIIWGGQSEQGYVSSGHIYDPVSDTWTPIQNTGAPFARSGHCAAWTGSKMIIWGAESHSTNSGGLYDPITDTWTTTSTINAPETSRTLSQCVWTGSNLIVWGGRDTTGFGPAVNTGAIYDPQTDSWTNMSTVNAPLARWYHTLIWTGSKMIVWGGYNPDVYLEINGGAVYDPDLDSWASLSVTGEPAGRQKHTAVWTGSKMIIWGGQRGGTQLQSGAVYDLQLNTWTSTQVGNAPTSRSWHKAEWTGQTMLIWGGFGGSGIGYLKTGSKYTP